MAKEPTNHLAVANYILDDLAKGKTPDEVAAGLTQLVIAEALTGILELLTKLTGEEGTVLDVRVGGNVSTHSSY